MKRIDPVVAVAFAAVLAYYAATPGIFQGKASGDGYDGFLYLHGIVFHHTLDMGVSAPDRAAQAMFERGPTGHVVNPVPIGVVPFWMPFYLAGLAGQRLFGMPVTGRSAVDFWITGLGACGFGLAGVWVLFALLRRRFGTAAARFGALSVLAATPLTWYLVTQPLYQHATAFFAVTLLIERWDALRERASITDVLLLGVIGGLAMSIRVQAVPWVAMVGIDLLLASTDVRRLATTAVAFAGAVALGFSPQAIVWYWQFGTIRVPQPPGHMRWTDPAIVEILFSTRAGLLPWSPILYLAIAGLFLVRRRARALASVAIIGFAAQVLVNASAWDYHASYTFGARRFVDSASVFGVGLAALYAAFTGSQRVRGLLWTACMAAAVVNLALMEAVRTRRVWDSAAVAAPASEYVRHFGGPAWMAAALDRTGYPFVQPAGWIWSLVHRARPSTFEAVVGNYVVDRDFRFRDILLHDARIPLAPGSRYRVDEGPNRVRVFVPAQNHEALTLSIVGFFSRPDTLTLAWNGHALAAQPGITVVTARVPPDRVRTRSSTNELAIDGLAPGTSLERIDVGFGPWQ